MRASTAEATTLSLAYFFGSLLAACVVVVAIWLQRRRMRHNAGKRASIDDLIPLLDALWPLKKEAADDSRLSDDDEGGAAAQTPAAVNGVDQPYHLRSPARRATATALSRREALLQVSGDWSLERWSGAERPDAGVEVTASVPSLDVDDCAAAAAQTPGGSRGDALRAVDGAAGQADIEAPATPRGAEAGAEAGAPRGAAPAASAGIAPGCGGGGGGVTRAQQLLALAGAQGAAGGRVGVAAWVGHDVV